MLKILMKACGSILQRVVMCGITAGVLFICHMQKYIFNRSLIDMVYTTSDEDDVTQPITNSTCPAMLNTEDFKNMEYDYNAEFYWDASVILAMKKAFHLGYLVSFIPSGVVSDYYGFRGTMGTGFLGSSIFGLLLPTLSYKGSEYLMIGRFFQGLCQGLVWPSAAVMVAHWAPTSEVTTFIGILEAAGFAGKMTPYMLPMMFMLLHESWKAKLYIPACCGMIFWPIWYMFMCNDPTQSPFISSEELAFLRTHKIGMEEKEIQRRLFPHVPWKPMFRSRPLLSMLLFFFGAKWVTYSTLVYVRTHLIEMVQFSKVMAIRCHGFGHLAIIFSLLFWGIFSDWLIKNGVVNRNRHRKWSAFLGSFLIFPPMFIILLAGCNGTVILCAYEIIFFIQGFFYSTFLALPIEMSPRNAGVVRGLLNFSGTFANFFCGEFEVNMKDLTDAEMTKSWRMFEISFVVFVLCTFPYLWYGTSEVQHWNTPLKFVPRRSQFVRSPGTRATNEDN